MRIIRIRGRDDQIVQVVDFIELEMPRLTARDPQTAIGIGEHDIAIVQFGRNRIETRNVDFLTRLQPNDQVIPLPLHRHDITARNINFDNAGRINAKRVRGYGAHGPAGFVQYFCGQRLSPLCL